VTVLKDMGFASSKILKLWIGVFFPTQTENLSLIAAP
jgi:hypothetical protein